MYIKKKKEVREMLYTVELVSLAILKTFFFFKQNTIGGGFSQ